jgi:type I restriction enzyme S subunit
MKLLEHFKELSLYPNNAEELKGLILQLAVQGKLTAKWREAHPNVEPASELLKRIEAEKQQLIAEKKIKKEKPLPPIKEDEFPYELPEGWKFSRLGSIIKISSGDGLTSRNMDKDGSIPVYGGNGITGYHSKFNVTKPEIVIGRVGYYCGSIHLTEDKAWVTDNAFVTKFSEQNIYRNYLVWLLKGTNLKENENATAQPVISGKKVYPIVIGFPPIEEQKAIVEVVNTLFKEVEQLESLTKKRIQLKESFVVSALNRLTESENTQKEWNFLQQHFSSFFTEKKNIKSLKETILQLAVQGKLTESWRANNLNVEPASELLKRIEAEKQQLIAEKKIKKEKPLPLIGNDEVPYEVPETWVWCSLIDISSINGGFAFKSSNYVDEGARVIRISDFDEQGFKNQKVVRYTYTDDLFQYVLEDRNILIAMTGGTVGKSLFVNKVDELMVVNQRVATIKIIQPIFEAYVNCVIPTRLIQDVIEEAKNSTNDNISMSDIKGFNIPLPPLEEQKTIVEKVNSLMALCDELDQQIETSQTQIEQLMQSCLKEVFEHESN